MPKISIVIPVYNSKNNLRRCVDSVLAQSFTDFELLLIDDGSSDGSDKMCDEYVGLDTRVSVFHKCNEGVSSARNLGLENATGEWVTFVDSDDFVYDNYLENFDVYNNDKFDIISQGLRIDKQFQGNSEFKTTFSGLKDEWLNDVTRNGTLGYVFIKLFKLEIIKENKICFDSKIRFQEDELFVLSYLAFCKSAKSVPKVGYFYFVPDWGKYFEDNINSKLLRTNRMLDVLQNKFQSPDQLVIFHRKKTSLLLYYIEGNMRHINYSYLKSIQRLTKEGYVIPHMPKILNKLLAIDFTLISTLVLMLALRLYSALTQRRVKFI